MACSAGSNEAIQFPFYGVGVMAGWPFVSEDRLREVIHEFQQQRISYMANLTHRRSTSWAGYSHRVTKRSKGLDEKIRVERIVGEAFAGVGRLDAQVDHMIPVSVDGSAAIPGLQVGVLL